MYVRVQYCVAERSTIKKDAIPQKAKQKRNEKGKEKKLEE